MPTFSGSYQQPGVYSSQQQTLTPVIPGGVRVAALIGTVSPTISVTNESITHGTYPNASDEPIHEAVSLATTITDNNLVVYNLSVDYQLTTGDIDWSLNSAAALTGTTVAPFADVNGLTFIFTIGSASPTTVTFSGVTTSIASVVSQINAAYADTIASNSANHLEISTGTLTVPVTKNSSLTIGSGTANAILGFTAGSFVQTPHEPVTGVKYLVSYTYDKVVATDYQPTVAFSMSDVVNYAGELSVDGSNNPTYTLPVAAQIAINNGASVLYLVGLDGVGSTYTQFVTAINKLQTINCNIVVPISTDPAVWAYSKAQTDALSSTVERKERTTYVGTANTAIGTVTSQAAALVDKRVLLCYNHQPTFFVGTSLIASVLDGSYIAAAIAGVRTDPSFDVAEPLTHKPLTGFATFTDTLLQSQKNQLASQGVLVVTNPNGGNPLVMDGTSTLRSTVDNEEISVTEATDFVIQTIRTLLEAIFIGQKILLDTPSQITSTTAAILTNLVSLKIINGYIGVAATVDNTDPSQIDLSFTIQSVYELKWIYITFGLAL